MRQTGNTETRGFCNSPGVIQHVNKGMGSEHTAGANMWAGDGTTQVSKTMIWVGLPRWEENLPINAGDTRAADSFPGSGKSPGEENGHPLQYSCLDNPMDREAWWAAVHGVIKSWTQLSKQASND